MSLKAETMSGNDPSDGEITASLRDLEMMPHDRLCEYFENLAKDHVESGTYATAADYIEAADRIRNLQKAYLLLRDG